ncbi:MAG: hypothetical protein ACR2QZ_04615 [Woeseiaceae bacterium]
MKHLLLAVLLPLIAALGACSATPMNSAPSQDLLQNVDVTVAPDSPRETLLLVSLEDGSVIMQTIFTTADLCFKMNGESATTCLTQGAPIYDPASNSLIGFEMIEEHIDLVAKSD